MEATRTLAAFAATLRFEDLPPEVVQKATLVLLDFVGNTFGGNVLAETKPLLAYVRALGGTPQATVLGQDFKTSLPTAAFAMGAVADALEHQDGYRFGGFHPSHTLPTLVALAEHRRASGKELLTAVVAAYEVANRVGAAVHPAATRKGWFPMAAGFGAAAGAARLLRLDPRRTADAIGAAAFFTPLVFLEQVFGGFTIKLAFAGQLARAGVEAGLLAEAGLTGWDEVLESPRGFAALLVDHPNLEVLTAELGSRWTILDVHHKAYAACRHTHGAAQACQELAVAHQLDVRAIAEVEVRTYQVALDLVNRPTAAQSSGVLCTLSLPYVAAVALTDRTVGAAQYRPERICDPELQRLASRVRLVLDPELEALYPEYTATAVQVRMQDGRVYQRRIDIPLGDPRVDFPARILHEKFIASVGPSLGEWSARQALAALLGLEAVADWSTVVRMLAGA
jgi:2-methylcitrate dehydratase PrpD